MVRFVILSLPRSGTNNLQSIINLHSDAFCWGEHMIGINDTDLPQRFPSFREYEDRSVKSEDHYLDNFYTGKYFEDMHIDSELPWNFGNPCTNKKAVGFRLFDYHQSPYNLDLLTRKKYKVIFVERQDLFWSTISHILMHKNIIVDKSFKWGNTTILKKPIKIPEKQFEDLYNRRKKSIKDSLFFLKEHNIEYLHLKYETMFDPKVYDSVFKFLSIDPIKVYSERYNMRDTTDKKIVNVINIKDLQSKYQLNK